MKGTAGMGVEIERKWLVEAVPETVRQGLSACRHTEIEQGYLCTEPVVRVRRDGEQYWLTYKGRGQLLREEYNLPLTEEAYAHLIKKADGVILTKTRYRIPLPDGLTAELDIFHGQYEGLIYVEVEFETEADARRFAAPGWFGRDVTKEPAYSNSMLSTGLSQLSKP
ncbi:MAG: CYTH domain-containing protein [Eubacteriales bacterium]|nr:CYTH domain-containing protein [Eubacteriales bacterium]